MKLHISNAVRTFAWNLSRKPFCFVIHNYCHSVPDLEHSVVWRIEKRKAICFIAFKNRSCKLNGIYRWATEKIYECSCTFVLMACVLFYSVWYGMCLSLKIVSNYFCTAIFVKGQAISAETLIEILLQTPVVTFIPFPALYNFFYKCYKPYSFVISINQSIYVWVKQAKAWLYLLEVINGHI